MPQGDYRSKIFLRGYAAAGARLCQLTAWRRFITRVVSGGKSPIPPFALCVTAIFAGVINRLNAVIDV